MSKEKYIVTDGRYIEDVDNFFFLNYKLLRVTHVSFLFGKIFIRGKFIDDKFKLI